MRKQLAAAAVMAAAAVTLAAAPATAQAGPETQTSAEASEVSALGWKYYGAYSSLSRCYNVGASHGWSDFACVEDYRDGRLVYELYYWVYLV